MIHSVNVDSCVKKYFYGKYSIAALSDKYIYVSAIGPNSTKSSACCDIARVSFNEWSEIPFINRVFENFKSATNAEPIVEVDDNGETSFDGIYLHRNLVAVLAEWIKDEGLKVAMKEIAQNVIRNYCH